MRIQHFSNYVRSHSGWCLFRIISIRDCVHSGLCPFGIEPIRDRVHLELCLFGIVHIRAIVRIPFKPVVLNLWNAKLFLVVRETFMILFNQQQNIPLELNSRKGG